MSGVTWRATERAITVRRRNLDKWNSQAFPLS
jgi:hypothetical protein